MSEPEVLPDARAEPTMKTTRSAKLQCRRIGTPPMLTILTEPLMTLALLPGLPVVG